MGSPLAFISERIGEGVAKTMTARKAPAGERSENAMDVATARLLAADIGNRRRTEKAWRQLRGGGNLSPMGFKSRHIPAMATNFWSHGGYKRTAAMPKPFRLLPTAAKSSRAADADKWRRKPTQRRENNAARTGLNTRGKREPNAVTQSHE